MVRQTWHHQTISTSPRMDHKKWPSPKEILDAGDVWADLELEKCFDLPDLVEPSQLYADKAPLDAPY